MRIFGALRDLYNLKIVKKTHGGMSRATHHVLAVDGLKKKHRVFNKS